MKKLTYPIKDYSQYGYVPLVIPLLQHFITFGIVSRPAKNQSSGLKILLPPGSKLSVNQSNVSVMHQPAGDNIKNLIPVEAGLARSIVFYNWKNLA